MQLDSTGLYSPTVKYTIGEWGHYVVTVNASRFTIYQNGVSVLHKRLSAPLEKLTRSHMVMGVSMNAVIAFIRIYNDTLDDSAVMSLYAMRDGCMSGTITVGSTCVACKAGSYSHAYSVECIMCSAGMHAPTSGTAFSVIMRATVNRNYFKTV